MAYGPAVAGFLRGGFSFKSGNKFCRFHGTRSAFDVEDRLHDVFLRAFSESARLGYDGISPYRSYLITIARNLVIDDFRKKQRALTEYSIDDVQDKADPGLEDSSEPLAGHFAPTGDPRKDAEAKELVDSVQAFVETLKPREAEIYRLRFRQGLDHKAISDELGLSPSKIKTSEKRVRLHFFEFMKKRGYFSGYVQEPSGWLRLLKRGREGAR